MSRDIQVSPNYVSASTLTDLSTNDIDNILVKSSSLENNQKDLVSKI